jgi:hypothetical protein
LAKAAGIGVATLQRAGRMKKITVNYAGWGEQWPLGTLAESGNELLFEYSPEA